jgi:hypothetical protein
MRHYRLFLYFFPLIISVPALAQQTTAPRYQKLAFLIPDLVEDTLQGVDASLRQVLQPAINPSFAAVNTGIAVELSNLPIPSPASAVRYVYNRELGVHVPIQQSQGPILTERAETIGKDRLFFALTYQRFQFDRLDDIDFRSTQVSIPIVFGGALPALIGTDTTISLSIDQAIAQITYGLTRWLDASYAQPLIVSRFGLDIHANVRLQSGPVLQSFPRISGSLSSTGLGDGVARIKARVFQRDNLALGMAADLRLPIGDELNYHGAGAYGFKPFFIASLTTHSISPHINVGYQINGSSYLASRSARERLRLPSQAFVSAGVEAAVSRRATIAFDVLNQLIVHGQRSFLDTVSDAGTSYNTLSSPNRSRQETNASIGFKARLSQDLILTANVLTRLNDAGLRARVVPLFGLSYIF